MLEAKSNAEFEVFSNLSKPQSLSQSLNDKIKFTFIDMSNKDIIHTSKSVHFCESLTLVVFKALTEIN